MYSIKANLVPILYFGHELVRLSSKFTCDFKEI